METKLLDLNAYGVEEMSVAEMRETDGGIIILIMVLAHQAWKWDNENLYPCFSRTNKGVRR